MLDQTEKMSRQAKVHRAGPSKDIRTEGNNDQVRRLTEGNTNANVGRELVEAEFPLPESPVELKLTEYRA